MSHPWLFVRSETLTQIWVCRNKLFPYKFNEDFQLDPENLSHHDSRTNVLKKIIWQDGSKSLDMLAA